MVGEPAINAHTAASAWVRLKFVATEPGEKKHPTITTSDTRVRRVSAKSFPCLPE